MLSNNRTYLIFGAPGSGKGTQGRALGTLPGFFHCACGDVFRSIDTRSSLGKAFIEYSSKGQLVPDEITVELWRVSIRHFIDSHQFKPEADFLVLDGIPRNVRQAELMDSFIDVTAIFYLRCSDREAVVSRLKKRAVRDNRLDDANETVIRQRLETYERETEPLLDHYSADLIVEVDASKSPIEVLGSIVSKVVGYQAQIPRLHHDRSSTTSSLSWRTH
jgi:adenylate kinase